MHSFFKFAGTTLALIASASFTGILLASLFFVEPFLARIGPLWFCLVVGTVGAMTFFGLVSKSLALRIVHLICRLMIVIGCLSAILLFLIIINVIPYTTSDPRFLSNLALVFIGVVAAPFIGYFVEEELEDHNAKII